MNKKGTKKITLYKRGGKLYYKKGGKMCLYEGGGPIRYRKKNTLPKYQGDLYSTSEIQPIKAPKQKTKNNMGQVDMGQVAGYAQLAAGVLDKFIPKTERDYGGSEEHYRAMKNMQTGEQEKMHQTVDSMIPVWGQLHGATRTLLDAIDQKDEYGRSKSKAAHLITNLLDGTRVVNIAVDDFKKGDVKSGIANLATAGMYGQVQMDKTKEAVDKQKEFKENRLSRFKNDDTGTTKSGIYARYGKEITTPRNVLNDNWNAEIENGEIVIDTSGKNIPNIRYGGTNTYASLQSPYAVKFTGDKHGEDSNKDGQEGIPIKAAEGLYVASNYLGLDGKKVKKGQKTVAQEMQPIVESLSNADTNSMDAYKNNDEFITHQLKQLEEMKNDAEASKVAEELKKLLSKKDRDMGEIAAFIQQNAEYLLNDPNAQQQNLPKMEEGNPDMQVAKDGVIIDKDDTTVNEDGDITVTKSTPQKNIIGAQSRMPVSEQTGMPTDLSAKLVTSEGGEYGDVFTPQGSLTSKMQNRLVSDYGMSSDDASKVTAYNLQNYKPIGKLISDYYGVRSGNQTLRSADPNVRGDIGLNKIQNQGQWAQGIINDIVANEGILPSKYVDLPASVKNEMLRVSRLPGNNKNISQGKFTPELKNAYNKAVLSNTREISRTPSSALKLNEMKPEFLTRGEAFNYYRKLGKPEFEWEGKRYTTKTRSEMDLDPLTEPIVYKTKTTPNVNYLGDKSNITNIPINKKGIIT
jgi:cytochrome c553